MLESATLAGAAARRWTRRSRRVPVRLAELRLADDLGGRAVALLDGLLPDVEAALELAARPAGARRPPGGRHPDAAPGRHPARRADRDHPLRRLRPVAARGRGSAGGLGGVPGARHRQAGARRWSRRASRACRCCGCSPWTRRGARRRQALRLRRRHPHGRPRRDGLLGGQPRGGADPRPALRAGGPRRGRHRRRPAAATTPPEARP